MKWAGRPPYNFFIVKMLLRYFFSFKKTCQEAEKYWGKHYSQGRLKLTKFDDKEKIVVYRLKNFMAHPVFCQYLTGYIQAIVELTNKSPSIKTRETKCAHQKGRYNEFVVSNWK